MFTGSVGQGALFHSNNFLKHVFYVIDMVQNELAQQTIDEYNKSKY